MGVDCVAQILFTFLVDGDHTLIFDSTTRDSSISFAEYFGRTGQWCDKIIVSADSGYLEHENDFHWRDYVDTSHTKSPQLYFSNVCNAAGYACDYYTQWIGTMTCETSVFHIVYQVSIPVAGDGSKCNTNHEMFSQSTLSNDGLLMPAINSVLSLGYNEKMVLLYILVRVWSALKLFFENRR